MPVDKKIIDVMKCLGIAVNAVSLENFVKAICLLLKVERILIQHKNRTER